MLRFECIDRGGMAQGEPDIVEAMEKTVATEGVSLKFCVKALIVGDFLSFE